VIPDPAFLMNSTCFSGTPGLMTRAGMPGAAVGPPGAPDRRLNPSGNGTGALSQVVSIDQVSAQPAGAQSRLRAGMAAP